MSTYTENLKRLLAEREVAAGEAMEILYTDYLYSGEGWTEKAGGCTGDWTKPSQS